MNFWIRNSSWLSAIFTNYSVFCRLRYAYSEEAGEEFDKDETSLSQMKPYPLSHDDDEARALEGSNGESENEVEENKTEWPGGLSPIKSSQPIIGKESPRILPQYVHGWVL